MTGFEVYLIMMLDNIRGLFIAGAVIAAIMFAAALVVFIADKIDGAAGIPWTLPLITGALLAMVGVLLTFTPSTKQAAVIYALPKIASADKLWLIETEAGEIYGLAKAWLAGQAGDSLSSRSAGCQPECNGLCPPPVLPCPVDPETCWMPTCNGQCPLPVLPCPVDPEATE